MRKIGSIADGKHYRLFRFFLYQQGIEIHEDPDAQGDSGGDVWILRDNDVPQAKALLAEFQKNPDDASYRQLKIAYRRGATAEQKKPKRRAKYIDVRTQVFNRLGTEQTPVNLSLLAMAILVFLAMSVDRTDSVRRLLQFSEKYIYPIEIFYKAQIWRVITPIFLHFGLLHILFNSLWLYQLGSEIERYLGSRKYFFMVAVISVVSNSFFFFISGPYFGGLSGVVYGLAAYCLVMNRLHPRVTFSLHDNLVQFFLWWHVICCVVSILGIFELAFANTIHAMGAVLGAAFAFFSVKAHASASYYKRLMNDPETLKKIAIGFGLLLLGIAADMSMSKGYLFYLLRS